MRLGAIPKPLLSAIIVPLIVCRALSTQLILEIVARAVPVMPSRVVCVAFHFGSKDVKHFLAFDGKCEVVFVGEGVCECVHFGVCEGFGDRGMILHGTHSASDLTYVHKERRSFRSALPFAF